jgi:hypothetical protein
MATEVGVLGKPLSREEIAQIEVGHTSVSPATARGLVMVFLVLISVPGLVELMVHTRTPGRTSDAWATLAALPDQVRATVAEQRASGAAFSISSRILAVNRTVLGALHAFEDALADESPVFAALRPPVQSVLSGSLGVGNERVYQGRDGWLFYRPDVDYVVGSGFLDPGHIRRRQESEREWIDKPEPDPRPALVAFKRQLEQRGIALIVVPTPVKPAMHPEKLGNTEKVPAQNPSYHAFVEDLRREHVIVFDVAEQLARNGNGSTGYLATDTHWRPETMERTAELLGQFIRTEVALPQVSNTSYRIEQREITNLGDTAAMLDLPDGHRLARPESVAMHRVVNSDGEPWQPSRSADVLVLGDSFSNIYSLASLGWGDGGGFVEHLSRILDRPVDRIVQNDDGAYATRARLRQDMATGSDRLRDKRVVILQFAARELVSGDWKRIELP